MVHWDDFKFILALHRHGTMTAAASALKTNVATVSRRIERVSLALGGPVFQRTGGAWSITPLGLKFVTVAEDFEAELNREQNNQDTVGAIAKAKITVIAPPAINSVILLPAVGQLLAERPAIAMTFINKLQPEGLGEADVFLRWGPPAHGRLVARKVGEMEFAVFRPRSAKYCGWVELREELDREEPALVGFAAFNEPPSVRVGLFDHKLRIMKTGGLHAVIPTIAGSADPDLERAPEYLGHHAVLDVWYGYHASRRDDIALRSAVSWIIGAFRAALRPDSETKKNLAGDAAI